MYTPPSFRVDDPASMSAFIESNSFATLVTCQSEEPLASHLPMRNYCENGVCKTLVSHMARKNPQWKHFANDTDVLTIFNGPHAYISPSWYASELAVPTWNYAAVHVYGRPTIVNDHDLIVSHLEEMIEFYERSYNQPWRGILPTEFRDKLIGAIVAFEIQITRIEGNFKLGQNRSTADATSVHNALKESNDSNARSVADIMKSEILIEKLEP